MKRLTLILLILPLTFFLLAQKFNNPIISEQLIFEEKDGLVAVEAEYFYKQSNTEIRQWYRTSKNESPKVGRDEDVSHWLGASNNSYLEILPDTRVTSKDILIKGDNFSNIPGQMAILHYKVNINKPGRYYVWARIYSTGAEDNGLHVGFNNGWPEHGQRMQWCDGKNQWTWASQQRTDSVHCGVPKEIYLDIEIPGVHEIQFSMREDGFEFDKFLLTRDINYIPEGEGPAVNVLKEKLPSAFPKIKSIKFQKEKPIIQVVDQALTFAKEQSLMLAQKYADQDSILPYSFVNGQMKSTNSRGWTSGFFPGVLWYVFENSHDSIVLAYAKKYTARIEREKHTTDNHDIGFMLYCSFGNGFRLTNDKAYKELLLTGAKSLSTRYNSKIGLIRSWDWNKNKWQYPVIIDNMMNLELLMWASKNSGDSTYRRICISHADKTKEHHYRPDYSCYHVVSYDSITGLPHKKQTHQGFSDESTWSRGQVWGLYGYTFMYRETKDPKYLEQACQIAAFMIHHPNMPADYIPYWDFDAPEIPRAPRDASAAAIMASALIELSEYVNNDLKELYLKVVEKQIRTLASSEYTANLGENGDFILKHSVGNWPKHSEIDAPLTYADYYYLEALLRYKKMINN